MRADRERALRRRVEAKLTRKIPNPVWKLVDAAYVEPARDGGVGALADLIKEVERLLAVYDAGAGGRPRSTISGRREYDAGKHLTATEIKIAELCSKEITRQSRMDPGVREFREQYLAGEALSEEDARVLLLSTAPRFIHLKHPGHPRTLIGHRSRAVSDRVLIPDHGAPTRKLTIRIDAPKPIRVHEVVVPCHLIETLPVPDRVSGHDPDHKLTIEYAPGTSFGALARTAERLSNLYHWDTGDASWFVLTDVPPSMPAFRAMVWQRRSGAHTDLSITLVVRPWVSPASVERAYRYVQRQTLGHRFRPIGEAQVQAWELIESRTQAIGTRPPWTSLFQEWRWKYRGMGATTWKNFARGFHRVRNAVMPGGITMEELNRSEVEVEGLRSRDQRSQRHGSRAPRRTLLPR